MKRLVLTISIMVACLIPVVSYAAGTLPSNLTWSNPVDVTDGVQIEKAASVTGTFVIIKQTAANAVAYTDAINSPGDNSCYRLGYFNTSGVGPYTSVVCKAFPPVPTQTPATFGVN